MKKRLSLTSATTDESLCVVARKFIRSAVVQDDWDADALYDRVVAIHKAREAIRRTNKRKRDAK